MSEQEARALLVEDDRAWQAILGEILADQGLSVDTVDTLEGAITCLKAVPHRLAVVDLSLHGDNYQDEKGLEVLDAARRLDPGCATVLLTGFATVELAVSVLTHYGAVTCLRKEAFRRAEFRQLVERVLIRAPLQVAAGGGEPTPQTQALPSERTTEAVEEIGSDLVLLVEDDAGWRSVLSELLTEGGYQVRACRSYGEALGYLRREKHILAVVDLSLASSIAPDENRDGYQVLASAQSGGIPAIVVSGFATPANVEHAYSDFGIFAYLDKQGFDRAVFRATAEDAAAAGRAARGAPGSELRRLTRRERDVLALLVQGLTNKGIANALVISTNTVKRYLKTIFEKLDVDSRSAAVAKAVSAGMKANPPRA